MTIANGVSVNFSAQTSGPYLGVLFFQDRAITSGNNATFAGGAVMKLTGSLYFPSTYVSFSNGSSAEVNSTAIVATQVSFTGGTNIKYDPTGLQTGLFLERCCAGAIVPGTPDFMTAKYPAPVASVRERQDAVGFCTPLRRLPEHFLDLLYAILHTEAQICV